MTEQELKDRKTKLVNLLRQKNYTYNELLYLMRTNERCLTKYLNQLQLDGFDMSKRYYSDGRTKIILPKNLNELEQCKNSSPIQLVTFTNETQLKSLIISDFHMCCGAENLKLLDEAFELAVKNGIHTIFCCGDLINGVRSYNQINLQDQMDYLIKNYPHDKNILSFMVLGDHEKEISEKEVINIARGINNARNDMIVGEGDTLKLQVRNEFIKMQHILSGGNVITTDAKIRLFGHSHFQKTIFGSVCGHPTHKYLAITAPATSYAKCMAKSFPSMLQMNIKFDRNYISSVELIEYNFVNNKPQWYSEEHFIFPKTKKEMALTQKNVEYYQPEHTSKVLKKTK